MKKELLRSTEDRILTGVCGGIGQYFKFNPNAIRLAFIVAGLLSGWAIILYLVLWFVLPQKKKTKNTKRNTTTDFFDDLEKSIKNKFNR